MKKLQTKKLALFLCLSLLLGVALPQRLSSPIVAKAATDSDTPLTCPVGGRTFIEFNTAKSSATYSCVISNHKIAKPMGGAVYTNTKNSKASASIYMTLDGLAVGDTTVKLKETYKNKTKVVKTQKLSVYENTSNCSYISFSLLPYENNYDYYLQLEKGDSVNVFSLIYYYGTTPSFVVDDEVIASYSNGILTANQVGETTLTMTNGDEFSTLTVKVIEAGNPTVAKARKICKNLDKLYTKKVTTKNVFSLANEFFSYQKQLNELSEYYYSTDTFTHLHLYKHTTDDFRKKFVSVIEKKVLVGHSGVSLEGITVKNATKKKATITFTKKLTKYDILYEKLCFMDDMTKITDKSTLYYRIYVSDFSYAGNIKLGAKKATLNSLYSFGKGGKQYYSTHTSSGKLNLKSVNIK